MISKWVVIIFVAIEFCAAFSYGAPCAGRGTVVFFGNGMFNTRWEAERSKRTLMENVRTSGFPNDAKELKSDLAYKRSEPALEQLLNVTVQKGITEFENFWAWLSSIEKAPSWFSDAVREKNVEIAKLGSRKFEDLRSHMESYAKYIRDGYNIILVSHSQGNLYANQVMRSLVSFTDASLTGSIEKKRGINSFFPKFFEIFANIQVATPVSATVNSSPWTTFKDDLVMAALRESAGALPGNIQSPGIGLPPNGDFLGHNFTKAYLRISESQQKVIGDVKFAYSRLRYPIAYFQPAVLFEHLVEESASGINDLVFKIRDPSGVEYPSGYEEEWTDKNRQVQKSFVSCFDLKAGDSKITAETIVDGSKFHEFAYTAWLDGGVDKKKEEPTDIHFSAGRGIKHWDVGILHVRSGSDKVPLDVQVEVYPSPRRLK